jgi:superfamily II DNA or RNA helicase
MDQDTPRQPSSQILIDFENAPDQLPPQEEFPLTIKKEGRQIKRTIEPDLTRSLNSLIVTGFTSLAQIIETFGTELPDDKSIRILFGVEPMVKQRKRWKEVLLSQEIKDFWLDRGISPFQCGAVLKTIEHIESGKLQFKILKNLHAKLYVTENYATLGSSNFSHSGLAVQHEANFRAANSEQPFAVQSYEAIKQIADYYWERGRTYSDEMVHLLKQLLVVVDWQEALARAVSELLEGAYVKAYLQTFEQTTATRLWPSQAIGIHQGLQILQEKGSLLVADPTGSGKTKMITVLQLALMNWLWETGRGMKVNHVVITPPIVMNSWKREQLSFGSLLPDPFSQGLLSWPNSHKYQMIIDSLRLANVLIIDEAHNFLNKSSARSVSMSAHRAEFIILSTATPINKKAEDLLRLVQLLDPDNLGDEELSQFKELYSKPPRDLEEDEQVIQQLKSYIWKFTLRRTKQDLNTLIKKEPQKYLNELEDECHYPDQKHRFYKTRETKEDIAIAKEIDRLTADLKGLIYLRTINFPKSRNLDHPEKRKNYIQARINTAKGLSRYRVQACLRSSRAALIELVEGTSKAAAFSNLGHIGKETGHIAKTLGDMRDNQPKYAKEWDVLPDWLTNEKLYQAACDEEQKIYLHISNLAKSMTDSREQAKASILVTLLKEQSLVIAFDHTIITLHCLEKIIHSKGVTPYVVSGTNLSTKQALLDDFRLGSTKKSIIALCSDVISEGVNLQAAPVVVMLDMPSVLRLAEQRIGRIDRLNSPHKQIFIYWPDDSKAFQLRADQNLIRTAHITKQLMGANLQLPDEMFLNRYEDLAHMSAKKIVHELESSRKEQEEEWIGMKDAFDEVRLLIDGPEPLLSDQEYERMVGSNATVRCKLSFVQSEQHWAFIALRGGKENVSRWLFIDEKQDVFTDFSVICHFLRERLATSEKAPFNEVELKHFIELFRQKERETLPHKKRRALNVAECILKRQKKAASKNEDKNMAHVIDEVLELFLPSSKDIGVDYQRFSVLWLDILSDWLKEYRASKKTKRWFSLEDLISKKAKRYSFTELQLRRILSHIPLTDPLEMQIASCIIGVEKGS